MPCHCWQNHICFCFTLVAVLIICSWIGKKIRKKKKKHCSDAPKMKTKLVVSHLVFRLHHSSSDNTNDFTTVTKWNKAVLDSNQCGGKNEKRENRNKMCNSVLMGIIKENPFNHNTTESNGTKCDWSWKSEENQHFPASAEDAAALKAQQKDEKNIFRLIASLKWQTGNGAENI